MVNGVEQEIAADTLAAVFKGESSVEVAICGAEPRAMTQRGGMR